MSKYLRQHAGFLTVLILALALRIAYLLTYSNLPVWDQMTVDNYYHHNWAMNIADGNVVGDTTYFRAPFYVFCLAALYSLLGASLWVARIFGLAIGLLSIWMSYLIASRVFDRKIGVLATLIHTLYPVCIYFESELLLDPLFMLLLQLAVHRFLIWWDSNTSRDIFLSGVWLGVATITRPTALAIVPVILVFMLMKLRLTKNGLKKSAALLAGMVLLIAPITVRNLAISGDPVLVASQGGINLYIGNNDAADGVSAVMPEPLGFNWRISQITHIAETSEGRSLKPGEVSSYWTDQAVEWILNHPGAFLSKYATKLYFSFSDREISNNRQLDIFFDRIPILKYNPISFGILFALSIVGVIFYCGCDKRAWFFVATILVYTAVAAVFFFSSRFRLPLIPFFIVLAAAALSSIVTNLIKRFRAAILPVSVAIAIGFLSFYPFIVPSCGFPSQYRITEGLYLYAQTDYRGALEAFKEAERIDPTYPETSLNLGNVYLRLGHSDSAAYYFEREKILHPGRVKANINLASIHLLDGRLDEALTEIKPALEIMPWDPIANMINLRVVFADSLTQDSAIRAALEKTAARVHDDVFVLHDAGLLLTERGKYEEARAIFLQAASSHPPPIETDDYLFDRTFRNSQSNWQLARAKSFYQLGFISGLQSRFAEAVDFSSRAILIDSSLAEAYVNLASGYLALGKRTDALAIVNLASARFPENAYIDRLKSLIGQ